MASHNARFTVELLAEKPRTAQQVADALGVSLSTAYVALREAGAKRTSSPHGYLYHPPTDRTEIANVGTVDGKTWNHAAREALNSFAEARLDPRYTAENYADGFEEMGKKLIELAAHARAVQDRPDWREVLGIELKPEN